MSYVAPTDEQLTRWRAIYTKHATPTLARQRPANRRYVMTMMQRAEQLAREGQELSDMDLLNIFVYSVRPGFVYRDDETIAACRRMMREAAEI
ncbi:fumarate hydratase class I [Novimethylophilus kurashikiensis]|uniref:Fumarate hydratase class I n=1 Tax=Novimethylophilus kurashikiensis TaxID=1825523 RepID=A0A2R5FC81_9PROT|nr:hypothetical protein [Novimethylophilus kurashikiensis]GBG14311.1 fumarate hydratase class I [Novimethylophilus kurashikiensis]